MSNFPMGMSDFSWQHQKYGGPEIYVVIYVIVSMVIESITDEKLINAMFNTFYPVHFFYIDMHYVYDMISCSCF